MIGLDNRDQIPKDRTIDQVSNRVEFRDLDYIIWSDLLTNKKDIAALQQKTNYRFLHFRTLKSNFHKICRGAWL